MPVWFCARRDRFSNASAKISFIRGGLRKSRPEAMLAAWQGAAESVRLVSVTDRVDLSAEADPEAAIAATWQQGLSTPLKNQPPLAKTPGPMIRWRQPPRRHVKLT